MSIATRMAGREVPCPKCGRTVRVPEPDDAAPPAPALDVFAEDASRQQTAPESPKREVFAPPISAPPAPAPAEFTPPKTSEKPVGKASVAQRPTREDDEEHDEAQVSFRRRKRDDEELDMTPLVDVTFLLLIFFMVTASFGRTKTLLFPPPEPEKKGVQSVQQVENVLEASIRVMVDSRNQVTVEEDRVADPAELPVVLREKMRMELKSEALISVDPRALHDTVVRVVDACNEAGFHKIRLSSRSEAN